METLNELVLLLKHYPVCSLPSFFYNNKSLEQDRYSELYSGLCQGKWPTEAAISTCFGYESPHDKGFRRLKEGLTERLLNALILAEGYPSRTPEIQLVSNELLRLWSAAEVLRKRGGIKAYTEVAHKCLEMAIGLGNTGVIIELTRQLKFFYLADPSKAHLMNKMKLLFNYYWPVYQTEIAIQNDYFSLIDQFILRKGYKKQFAPEACRLFEKYTMCLTGSESMITQYYTRYFHVWSYSLTHDWKGAMYVLDDAIDFFGEHRKSPAYYLQAFSNLKSCCLIMLGRFNEAAATLEKMLLSTTEGTSLWFKNRELATINAMYAANYNTALGMVRQALAHSQYSKIAELDKETWRLYNGYLHFVILKGDLPEVIQNNKEEFQKFRVKKWMNDMPLYSNDKRGGNIPVLILQVHFLILDLKDTPSAYDEIEKRAEALRKYASRNLDKNCEHFRTDCFLSLIQLLPKYLYTEDWDALYRASRPILAKMASASTDILDTSFEIEVVPYERQWDWVLDILMSQTKQKRRCVPALMSQSLQPRQECS